MNKTFLNKQFRWLSLAASIYAGLFSFLILLLRPFWFDIEGFLHWATGLDLPWIPLVLIFSLFLSFLHFRWTGHFLYPAFTLLALVALTILLFLEMGNESAMIFYQLIDYFPIMAIVMLLVSTTLILPSYVFWRKKRIRLAALLSLLMLSILFSGRIGTYRFVGQPYLQAPDEQSMTIIWQTSRNSLSHVEYGDDFQYRAYPQRDGSRIATSSLHRVTLDNLEPGTEYQYRVISKEVKNFFPYNVVYGREISSEAYKFKTFDSTAETSSFLIINDFHERNELWTDIVENCLEGIDFVVLNGDFFNDLNHSFQIKNRFVIPVSRALASEIPFILTRGNHETRGKLAGSLKDFTAYPENRYYFKVKQGPADLIFLDSGEDKEDKHMEYSGLADFKAYREKETLWLRSLASADMEESGRPALAFSHIPLNEFIQRDSPHLKYQKEWTSILERMGVDLLFSGHTHVPEIVNASADLAVPIIIGGGDFADRSGFALVRVDMTESEIHIKMMTEKGDIKKELTISN